MIDYIKEFCDAKGIKYFYVSSFNENGNVFDFDNTNQSINDFLEFGILTNQKYLLIETEIFNFEIEDPYEELEKYDQEICCIDLYWINDGIIHKFQHIENWYEEYLNGDKNSDNSIFNESFDNNIIKLSKDQINSIIEGVINHENYFKYNTRSNKLEALLDDIYAEKEIEKENLSFFDKQFIKNEAQRIFSKQYLTIKEKEYSKIIKNFKDNEGLSKKAIIAKLDITEGIYEKCYNQ